MKKILLAAATCLVMTACTKNATKPQQLYTEPAEQAQPSSDKPAHVVGATIHYEEGGRGWYLVINRMGEWVPPINLSEAFKHDGWVVDVVYRYTEKIWPCRDCTEKKYWVEILRIDRMKEGEGF